MREETTSVRNAAETSSPETYRLHVAGNWDGEAALPGEEVIIAFSLQGCEIKVAVEAPFHDDPPPLEPAGQKDDLWNFEVVELFLLGKDGRYLEIELGPHGHYLVLVLDRIRQVNCKLSPVHYSTRINGSRWQGSLTLIVNNDLLPFTHANGYAMHAQGNERRFLAASPVPGERPDFHQPARFVPLTNITYSVFD